MQKWRREKGGCHFTMRMLKVVIRMLKVMNDKGCHTGRSHDKVVGL